MKAPIATLALVLAAFPSIVGADGDLLARMSALDRGLHSYTATLKAHVALSTFPFLATDIVGTYYHKDPDLNKLEITSGLPGIAQQFGKLYPNIEPPARWNRVYRVTMNADDGKTAHFTLVPRKAGNVESIEAVVDDRSATVSSMTWNYGNGGKARMNDSYAHIGGYSLVVSQTGSVDEPSYKGTVTSSLSGYRLNPALDDSVFKQGQ